MRLPAAPRVRVLLAALLRLGAVALVVALIDRLSPAPKGPPGSSYATSPRGLAAYAAVLERAGQPVRRVRTRIAERPPHAGEPLLVLEPGTVEPEEARAIARWVRGGGRLVAGGSGEQPWLEEGLGAPPPVAGPGAPDRHAPLVPVTETAGVREVRSAGELGYHDLGRSLPVIGLPD